MITPHRSPPERSARFWLAYGVKERCVWIAHVEDHDPQGLGAAAVLARHFHLGRFHHRLTGFHRDWRATLHLQCKYAFQDVDGHGETVCMERSLVARLEGCREDAHLLPLALGHALYDFSDEQIGLCDTAILRHRRQTNHQSQERETEAYQLIHLYSPSLKLSHLTSALNGARLHCASGLERAVRWLIGTHSSDVRL